MIKYDKCVSFKIQNQFLTLRSSYLKKFKVSTKMHKLGFLAKLFVASAFSFYTQLLNYLLSKTGEDSKLAQIKI